jgi:predicted ArsR family transcriptional regulator
VVPTKLELLFYRLAERAETSAAARRVLVAMAQGFFRLIVLEKRRGGSRLLRFGTKAAKRWGRWRGPVMRDALGVDANDMGDMARIQDWEDRVFGVTGHWPEKQKSTATKCETECPFAEVAKGAPEICTDLVHALETETFRAINPSYRLVPLERLLSKGERACEFRHEIG